MDHGARSDAELVSLAQQGWASAFAVLLHRHGAAVADAVREADNPQRALVDTFTDAMAALDAAPHEDVAGWLTELAHPHVERTRRVDPHASVQGVDLDLDAAWAVLSRRWPTGRPPLQVHPAVAWTGAVLATLVLSAGLPWLALGPLGDEPELLQLRAFPIDDERPGSSQPDAEEDAEEEDPEPLPTYDFPIPPTERDPQPPDDDPAADDQQVDETDPDPDPDPDPDADQDEDLTEPDQPAEEPS